MVVNKKNDLTNTRLQNLLTESKIEVFMSPTMVRALEACSHLGVDGTWSAVLGVSFSQLITLTSQLINPRNEKLNLTVGYFYVHDSTKETWVKVFEILKLLVPK